MVIMYSIREMVMFVFDLFSKSKCQKISDCNLCDIGIVGSKLSIRLAFTIAIVEFL